jgi:alkaline phosphatase D
MGNLFTAIAILLTLTIQTVRPTEKCYKLAFGSCFR